MTAPRFSIVIPVYNGGAFLGRTVRSALDQTFTDFEIILVDDGSTDDACGSLKQLEDRRLRVLSQPNQGPAIASNVGVAAALGEFVAFLDQDDLWLPDKLQSHIEAFEANPGVDLSFTWYEYMGEQDQPLGLHPTRWQGGVSFEHLLGDNVIGPTSTVAIRQSAFDAAGGFDPQFQLSYDLDLHLRVLRLRPNNALAVPHVLARYRRHPQQMSRDWRALRDEWTVLLEKYALVAPDVVRQKRKTGDTVMSHYVASVAYERRDFAGGLGEVLRAARHDPLGVLSRPRYWRLALGCLAGWILPRGIHRRLERLAGISSFAAHTN